MTATSTLRNWWAPACKGPFIKVALYGAGSVQVRSAIVPAVEALDLCLRAFGYKTRKADTGAFNCRKITGGNLYSLHAYGVAVDINWQSNPYGRKLITDMPPGMIAAIKRIRTKNGRPVWRWGGDYTGNKDAMHFEIICHPRDLATGIDPSTLPKRPDDEEFTVAQYDEIKRQLDRIEQQLANSTIREERAITLLHKLEAVAADIDEDMVPDETIKQHLATIKNIAKQVGAEVAPYPAD